MHCLKNTHDSHGDLKITLYERNEVHRVSITDWQNLQTNCKVVNPFYEDWHLLPALEHLTESNDIYLVTVYQHQKMVALFPIEKHKLYGVLPQLRIWQHDHAFMTDPLILNAININPILNQISYYLGCVFSLIPQHKSPDLVSRTSAVDSNSVYSAAYERAAIFSQNKLEVHLDSLSGKPKRELLRSKRKLENKFSTRFITFNNLEKGLKAYQSLEHSGWKGEKKGSILSLSSTKCFYHDLIKNGSDKNIEIQGLMADSQLIASAIRIKSNDHFFEIKTTYDENFRSFSPGKLLEWNLLQDLSSRNFKSVDSCTSHQNKLINWLWPERVSFYRSYVFGQHPISKVISALHNAKQWIEKRYTHA